MLKLFQELKNEFRDKDKRFKDFNEQPSLNCDDHDESMSDRNDFVLTDLTRDQFNDLSSYMSGYPESSCNSCVRKSENNNFYIH